MSIIEIVLIGIGLSMDAFAVATCRGVEMKKFNIKNALIVALFFGLFQALMPLIGFYIGTGFQKYIMTFDHYIAFSLLTILGAKMIVEAFKKDKDSKCDTTLKFWPLILMAVATSIDALVVGVTFGFIGVNIWLAILIIGSITFILSFIGVFIGQKIGSKFKQIAEVIGGVVLILIGLKILLEHLGVIAF
jgi:manganese efflux pump family protein